MKIGKLYPECKDYIWGGNKLKTKYGKQTNKTPCAESWELSFHKDGLTRLANGKTLMESVTESELGENITNFPFFPVLIKFIDAEQNLSVQVHPSDDYALQNENSFGKTEMWYIVEAEQGAGIYLGFNRDVTKEEYQAAIKENRLTELLNFYEVKAGECYFIPSGTIHAIGKGCLICEIQQNSNLTYRVYDYGRKDKNGNERELHIDKALAVTTLTKHENKVLSGDRLGVSKYFTVKKLCVKNEVLRTDGKTFQCLTCVKGQGEIDGQAVVKGDSFFVPANHGKYTVKGDMEIILTEIRKYYIGIDLGGTFIKGGIVDDMGNIVLQDKVPTESEKGAGRVATNIANLCKNLLKRVNMSASDMVGIGMGVPGMIDSAKGEVVYSNNLNWEHFFISEEVEKQTGLPVKIANDANVAALGETKFGCGKAYNNTVMITLGTGVGGGIIIDGKLFEGNRSAGAELGHSVIVVGGEQCTCGRKGCLEAYASATALIRDTKRAMLANKNSKMWEIGDIEKVTGKTAFDYKDCDQAAKTVVDSYIEKLGVGITNIANEFRPEAVILGGGVCAEGEKLIKPLQEFVNKEIFAGNKGPQVKILTATLGNSAGLLGAIALYL
jgi:glucokinase-like ROK family protein